MTSHPAATQGVDGQPGHYNPITKTWDADDKYTVTTQQDGKTMPDGEPEQPLGTVKPPSFVDQVKGNAKKFAGMTFGKPHEKAQGEALLEGKGVEGALLAGEQVKAREASS